MPTNDFKPFATAGGANVSTQAEYLALAALSTGWQSGKASSKEVNKAVRQATFIAAAIAQFIADKGDVDVLDDGDLAGLGAKLISAMNKTSQPLDATLTALAALVGAANKLPYFNGADTAALTDLTQVGRDIIGKNAIADVLQYLGLGEAAKKDVGIGSGQVPDMSYFASQKAGPTSNGWQKIPGGLIIQWYTATHPADSTPLAYNFPIPFPNAFLTDSVVVAGATNNRSYVNGSASSNTSRQWIVSRDQDTGGSVSLSSIVIGW